MNTPKLSIESQFHQLDEQLSIAKYCFKLYQNMALDSSSLSKEEFEKFAKLFEKLVKAERIILSQTLLIQIHKFFDKHHRAIQLKTIIENCKNNTEYCEIKQQYDALLETHEEVIKILRNKVYAHTDIENFSEDYFKTIKTTYTDLKNIVDTLEKIMSTISTSLRITRLPSLDASIVNDEHLKMIRMAISP